MKKNIFFCALFVSLLTSFVTACDLLPGMGPSSGDPTPPPVEDDITPTPPPVEEEDEIAPTVIASISAGIVNQKAQFSYTVSDNVTKTEDLEVTVSLKLGEVDVAYDSNNEFIPTQAGDYVLTVSAQDEEGNVGTDTQTVTVDANGSFVCEEGTPDVGVTIATDMKSLAITSEKNYTLQLALNMYVTAANSDLPRVMAAAILAMLPSIGIYMIVQKYFIQGIAMSGLKA